MTNEEKAKEIAENQPFAFCNNNYRLMIEWGAEKMAEWKDSQFKEYLERKYEIAKDIYMRSSDQSEDYTCGRVDILVDIINELFGE